jgi:antitoxin component YwqK of YwqJK toxin-antitoxin module
MTDNLRVHYDELELGSNQLLTWRGEPFTGTAYETDSNGTVIGDARYVQGLQTGVAHEWSAAGQLLSECAYEYGSKDGLCRRWYKNARPECEAEYRFSIKVREKCWSADGELVKDWALPPEDPQWALIPLLEKRFRH